MIAEDGKSASATPASTSNPTAAKQHDAGLDRAIQARIGDRLRAMYDTLAEEPVPDRLAEILRRLEGGEKS